MFRYFLTIFIILTSFASGNSIGNERLEIIEGQKVLYVQGSAYEMGYQHGKFLKSEIFSNLNRFIEPMLTSNRPIHPVVAHFLTFLPQIIPHISPQLVEEMHGIADAAEVPYDKILLLNLFPEMFHCSGITVKGKATLDHKFYHVRVLDYSAINGLQNTAVLLVAKPNQGYPFLNITYAGFVGCVTGMNEQKIGIGEIGGKGYGYWDGVPMAFLLRDILQNASSLDQVKTVLKNAARTCEYYYVFSDGKTQDSFAAYATPEILEFMNPGECYQKHSSLKNTFETPFTIPQYQEPLNLIFTLPEDILMISRGDHFFILKQRLMENYGKLTLQDLKNAIKQPIAHQANLHNAIFAPETLDAWISHAGEKNEPACDQPYHHFNLTSLLGK